MEWRVQTGALAQTRWRYTFPLLCLLGGAVMLTHTHTALGTKREFLIEVSHAGIAVEWAGSVRAGESAATTGGRA